MAAINGRILKESFQPREYQAAIANTALKKNTLVVLPTGMGKTYVAMLVVAGRLESYPDSKAMILAPTRPLVNQHRETFLQYFNLEPESLLVLTGKIPAIKRIDMYERSKIIFATPQLIKFDLEAERLSLNNFSLLVVDECHRTIKRYPYPLVAKKYTEQSKYPLILGLTASPGGTPERIKEICSNLYVEAVEIRTEKDFDVLPYVQPVKREWVYVELPKEFQQIRTLIEESFKEDIFWLRDRHYLQTLRPSKKLLLELQKRIAAKYMEGPKNYSFFWAMMRTIEAIKLEHALELLETQGISQLFEYLKKIEGSKKMADRRIMKDPRIREAFKIVENLVEREIEHPKLEKLVHVVKDILYKEPNARIIVFANYRDTVEKINRLLVGNGITSEILIGQTIKSGKGLTQQQQIDTLKRFAEASFSVLCGTSISEEGLSVADVPYVIFYEPIASEIRTIQRRGRTGRTSAGTVIFLVTKGTRDEAYYWSAFHRERKMKGILYDMREKGVKIKKEKIKPHRTLFDWAEQG